MMSLKNLDNLYERVKMHYNNEDFSLVRNATTKEIEIKSNQKIPKYDDLKDFDVKDLEQQKKDKNQKDKLFCIAVMKQKDIDELTPENGCIVFNEDSNSLEIFLNKSWSII